MFFKLRLSQPRNCWYLGQRSANGRVVFSGVDRLLLDIIRCDILTQSLVELVGSGDKSEKRADKLSACMAHSLGNIEGLQ